MICPREGARLVRHREGGHDLGICPECSYAVPWHTVGLPPTQPWSAAQPKACGVGHKHPSRLEARVCDRLRGELQPGERLYRNVRFPLLSIAPQDTGVPLGLTLDFVIVRDGQLLRAVDAKPKRRRSRDWLRGQRAWEVFYGLRVELANDPVKSRGRGRKR